MNTRKAATRILVVFFTIMLLFTLFAEDLYHMTLPKVATRTSTRKVFPYEVTGIDGSRITVEKMEVAVPGYAVIDNSVYVLTETEQGAFVTKQKIQTGKSAGGWLEVKEGLSGRTKVVIGSDRKFKDGAKVLEDEKNQQISLYRMKGTKIGNALDSQYYRLCMKNNIWHVILAAAFTLLLVGICKVSLKGRWRLLWTPVMVLWCVLVCFYFRRFIVIPPEWIPEKLIDWNGWRENIRQFWI